jgi:hypothetical protein
VAGGGGGRGQCSKKTRSGHDFFLMYVLFVKTGFLERGGSGEFFRGGIYPPEPPLNPCICEEL